MAIIQALFAALSRSLGKILNTAFGWATIMLFGKVQQKKQIYLSGMAFGAILWIVAVVGVAFPSVGTFLIAFAKTPDWLKDKMRLIMLALVILVPAGIGIVSYLMLEPDQRPKDWGGRAKLILKGYPYTLGLALTLVFLTIVAPLAQLRNAIKRWTSTHIPVIVDAPDYMKLVDQIRSLLDRGGIKTSAEQASWTIRMPTKLLTLFAGGMVKNLVADKLTSLKNPKLEVLLHPSDLVISGEERTAIKAHALVTEHLAFTAAYMTWTKEANEIEDKLDLIYSAIDRDRSQFSVATQWTKLEEVRDALTKEEISYEEWEILFRQTLQVEERLYERTQSHQNATQQPQPANAVPRARPARPKRASLAQAFLGAGIYAALEIFKGSPESRGVKS